MTKSCFPVQTHAEPRGDAEETETSSKKESSQKSAGEYGIKAEAMPLRG